MEGMMRTLLVGTACLVLVSSTAFAQAKPAFEVASIRPSGDTAAGVRVGFQATGSQVRVTAMSIKDYLGIAYRLRLQQIEGPEWMAQARFDVSATIPDGAPGSQVPEMLQTLLSERFQLKVHRETKDLPVYVLGVGKAGPKLQPSAPPDPNAPATTAAVNVSGGGNSAGVSVDMGGGSSFTLSNNQLQIRRMRTSGLADVLTRFVDRPVIDQTGIDGVYDITLDLTAEDYTAMLIRSAINAGVALPPQAMRLLESASPDTVSAPLSKFGLTFDMRRAPLEVLVVDSVLKTPTEN
jgi:uncharacterized protein (TIGR03435 family)